MSVPVPLEELRSELDRRTSSVYLLTVGDDERPHCVAVALEWHGDEVVIRSGTTSVRNAAARRRIALLSPASPPLPASDAGETGAARARAGYSLIVDGEATQSSPSEAGGGVLRVTPTHAVLHRPAIANDSATAHDCVPVYDAPRDQNRPAR